MQANKVRDEIKRSIEDYISDIKPFGNTKSTVEITNDRLYTSHETPNGLEIKDWGKINANDPGSSALKIMGEMRNQRDNKGD
jgi:hypothetical protein